MKKEKANKLDNWKDILDGYQHSPPMHRHKHYSTPLVSKTRDSYGNYLPCTQDEIQNYSHCFFTNRSCLYREPGISTYILGLLSESIRVQLQK